MSYDRNIAEARRLARARARTSGLSHQQTLDDIARRSGRADWKAFIADPCPPVSEDIVDHPADQREAEVASVMRADVPVTSQGEDKEGRIPSSGAVGWRRRKWMVTAGTSLLIAATAAPTVTRVMMDESVGVGDTVMLSEERRRASTTPLPSVNHVQGTVYTTVRPFRRHMRIAMMAIFDYRPVKPWLGQRYVMPALARIGLADSAWTWKSGGYPWAEVPYHPVVRLSMIVDCRRGLGRWISSGLADDFVSPLAVGSEVGNKRIYSLSQTDRTTLCSKDIMDQSDVLRNLRRIPNEPDTV